MAAPVGAVLAAGSLAAVVGAGPLPGSAAVLAALVVPGLAAASVLRRRPPAAGPADLVTLARTALIGVVAATTVLALVGQVPVRTWPLAAVAGVALALDAVDGWVARRTGTASEAGGRLDMESDAALLLVLSALLVPVVGWFALLVGGMRYAFVLIGWWRPALRGELRFSQFRRVVAAVQGSASSSRSCRSCLPRSPPRSPRPPSPCWRSRSAATSSPSSAGTPRGDGRERRRRPRLVGDGTGRG
ncbi:hypothetical protein GCM10025875_29110 [Litorihabitans aurantiacus]|uniref:CDP-alcohol phosphatidyltransferase family protein n=1 Tax=Litorihabitans aurantiacus TaxID=1930061 RepID=A0AA38CUM9_9MICO|nr:hypothetical protein GCM10025875_29110 [Litorihabitans aurantiacus]